jgi:xanthine/uracil permease
MTAGGLFRAIFLYFFIIFGLLAVAVTPVYVFIREFYERFPRVCYTILAIIGILLVRSFLIAIDRENANRKHPRKLSLVPLLIALILLWIALNYDYS